MRTNDLCMRQSYRGGERCHAIVVKANHQPDQLVCMAGHRWDSAGQRWIDTYRVRESVRGRHLAWRINARLGFNERPRLARLVYRLLAYHWWSGPTWQAEWDEAPFAIRGITERGVRKRAVEVRYRLAQTASQPAPNARTTQETGDPDEAS